MSGEVKQYIDFGLEKLNQVQAQVQANLENINLDNLKQTVNVGVEEVSGEAAGRFIYFMTWVLALWAVRVAVLKYLVRLSRSDYAEVHRITKRPAITGAQLERESVWKYGFAYDTIAMMVSYWAGILRDLPFFDWRAFVVMAILHATVVEFVYYWFHRALHWSWIYKNFHQYHHKSINTEPTTGLSFEIAERLSYTLLFATAPFTTALLGYQSVATFFIYFVWFDIMNEGGHINFDAVPEWFHRSPLRYIIYSPSFHAVHHTKFKKNFSLFMPWTDIVFGSAVYTHDEQVLPVSAPGASQSDVMLLVHAGYVTSALYSKVLHGRVLSAFVHQKNLYQHKIWMYLMYPYLLWGLISWSFMHGLGYIPEDDFPVFTGRKNEKDASSNSAPRGVDPLAPKDSLINNSSASSDAYVIQKPVVKATTWIILNFGFQYVMPMFSNILNTRIERAVLDAHSRGIKVVGLGNFNKAEWLNKGGSDIVDNLKDRIQGTMITHGDTLCAAVIVQHCIELRRSGYWKTAVFITGATSKIGRAVCLALAKKGIPVKMFSQCKERVDEIAAEANPLQRACLLYADKLSDGADCDLWLTGKMIPYGRELLDAIPLNATVMNFSVPDPLTDDLLSKRRDLLHLDTSLLGYDKSMMMPSFTWLLPEGLIYACLGGALVHAALGLTEHEVGAVNVDDMDRFWAAAQAVGFFLPRPTSFYKPTTLPTPRHI